MFRSQPITNKTGEVLDLGSLRVTCRAMQGWRRAMEDSHVIAEFEESGIKMIGLFDGHGGEEVAIFAAEHLSDTCVKDLKCLSDQESAGIIVNGFLEVDKRLRTQFGIAGDMYEVRKPALEEFREGSKEWRAAQNLLDLGLVHARHEEELDKIRRVAAEAGTLLDQSEVEMPKRVEVASDFGPKKTILQCTFNPKKKRGSAHNMGMMMMKSESKCNGNEISTLQATAAIIPQNAGAAATVVFVQDHHVVVATAGDCQAVMARFDEEGNYTTIDLQHRIHQLSDPEEVARVEAAGMSVVDSKGTLRINGELAVARGLGDLRFKNPVLPPDEHAVCAIPELFRADFESPNDFIIAACDGVFEVLSPEAVVGIVHTAMIRNASPTDALDELLDACLCTDRSKPEGKDNMTALIISLS